MSIDDNVCELVCVDDFVGATENDAHDDFTEEKDDNIVRLCETVGRAEMVPETQDETVGETVGEESFDGNRADCEPVKLLYLEKEEKDDTETLSVA